MLGSTSLDGDLTVTLSFAPDGAYDGLDAIRDGAIELGHGEACAMWIALPEAERERIESECWEDASLS